MFIRPGGSMCGCLLNYACNFLFMFVKHKEKDARLQGKNERFAVFLFAFKAFLWGEIGLGFDSCRVFPTSLPGLLGHSEILFVSKWWSCPLCLRVPCLTRLRSTGVPPVIKRKTDPSPLICGNYSWLLLESHSMFQNFGLRVITLNFAKRKHWNGPVKMHVQFNAKWSGEDSTFHLQVPLLGMCRTAASQITCKKIHALCFWKA